MIAKSGLNQISYSFPWVAVSLEERRERKIESGASLLSRPWNTTDHSCPDLQDCSSRVFFLDYNKNIFNPIK
jgi:hypothetical protein